MTGDWRDILELQLKDFIKKKKKKMKVEWWVKSKRKGVTNKLSLFLFEASAGINEKTVEEYCDVT